MRRLLLALAIVLLAAPAAAEAHPLGNLSVNHLATVSVSEDRVDVTWLVDQAEVPTFQERGLAPSAVLARKRSEALSGLKLRVDGRIVALRPVGPGRISFPAGSGGLKTTRVELELSAPARGARQVRLEDATFPGRVGWRAVVARPGDETAVRSSVPASDPTGGLRRYPEGALSAPADTRVATLRVAPGDGTVSAPGAKVVEGGGSDGFAGLLDGDRVLILLLLAAFAWGAVHALSPGHGKAMVAAYLVGTRGTPRDAVALGAIVTVTHTIGVFALGVVTLALSAFVLPEDLYPWLNLASGLLVLGVGAALVRGRLRARGHHHHHHHGHHHDHDHDLGRRGLLAMGASAGLIPCPSALVVLLGAISQHEIGLGLVLIVAFSLGLASTLTGLGLAVVHAGRGLARLNVPARVITTLPAASAALVAVVGVVLTIQSIGMIR